MTSHEITATEDSIQLEPFLEHGEDVVNAIKASRCAGYVLERFYVELAREPDLSFGLWVRQHFALDKVVQCELVIPDNPGILIDGPELPRVDGIATDEGLGVAPVHANR